MRVFLRAVAALVVSSPLLSTGACCTIAGLLCGPDKSRWVSRDYRTPDAALATLLEAIRRDQPTVIHECLSESAKKRYGLTGVVESTVAWQRLKNEVSGLHLAGSATPSPPVAEPGDRVRYDLSVAGRTLTVRMVEQPFWEVWFRIDESGDLERAGRFLAAKSLAQMLVLQSEDEPALVVHVRDGLLPELTRSQIREVRLGHAWKVDELVGFADS